MKESNKVTAKGINLPISTKQSIEVCNFIRGKTVKLAKEMLEKVVKKKLAVPMKRFNRDTGHKKGKVGPGRYPVNACSQILKLVNSVENNAMNHGLNAEALKIVTLMANKGSGEWHYGRQRRRQHKRSNVTIIVEEVEAKKRTVKKEPKEESKQSEKKVEVSKESKVAVEKKSEKKVEAPKKAEVKKEEPKTETKESKPAAKKEVPKVKEKPKEEEKK